MSLFNMSIPSPPLHTMYFVTLSGQSQKRVEENGHPCFIPVVLVITLDNPLGCLTYAHAFSYSAHVDQIMSEGILSAWSLCRRTSLDIALKPLQKARRHQYTCFFFGFAWFSQKFNSRMWSVVQNALLHPGHVFILLQTDNQVVLRPQREWMFVLFCVG